MADNLTPATGAAPAAAAPSPAPPAAPDDAFRALVSRVAAQQGVSLDAMLGGQPSAGTEPAAPAEAAPEAETAPAAAEPEAPAEPAPEAPAPEAALPAGWTPEIEAEASKRIEAATKDFQAKLTAAEAKAAEAAQQAAALGKQLEAVKGPPPVLDGVPLVRSEAELDRWVADRNEIIAWCNANRNGVEPQKDGDPSYTAEQVQALRDRVDMELRTALPKAQKLVAGVAYWDQEAKGIFPAQFQPGSEDAAAYTRALEEIPGLGRFPHARIVVGQTLLGQRVLKLFAGKSEPEILKAIEAVAKATAKPAANATATVTTPPAKKSLPPIKSSPPAARPAPSRSSADDNFPVELLARAGVSQSTLARLAAGASR